jgi:hypothetical protein
MDDNGMIYEIEKSKKSPEQIKEDQERLREAMRTGPVEILDKLAQLEREKEKEREGP